MDNLVTSLKSQYPKLSFKTGDVFSWSSSRQTITYVHSDQADNICDLLHELGHAILVHSAYDSDMELLTKEVAAWKQAKEISMQLGISIDDDHIEQCLDSYRDWIFKRSSCPECRVQGIQKSPELYFCLNCVNTWHVTKSRFCRPYRRSK